MIARFIGTTIKAVAHDIARFTAALGRVDKAARALLGAHERLTSFTANLREFLPSLFLQARTERMSNPILNHYAVLDITDGSNLAARALVLGFRCLAYN